MWLVVVLMIEIFFLFVVVVDGWIFFNFFGWPLVMLTMVGSEFAIDGGDGRRRI